MIDLEERYDMRAAAAWVLGHARRTGVPELPADVAALRVDGCGAQEMHDVVEAGQDAGLALYPFKRTTRSLPRVRRVMGVGPQDDQGRVAQEATERARACLRDRRPFVWNATNLTVRTRRRIVGLCEGYGARVRIVYLEAPWDVTLGRNAARDGDARVPVSVIEHMLSRLEPPLPGEADAVEWHCV